MKNILMHSINKGLTILLSQGQTIKKNMKNYLKTQPNHGQNVKNDCQLKYLL